MTFHIDDLLSAESVRYNANSPLRTMCIGIASACVTAYTATVAEGNDAIYRAISDILTESSHQLRQHTGIDVTLKVPVPNKSALDSSSGYSVEVAIPKMALSPSSMYPKVTDRQMDQLLAGRKVDVVAGEMDIVRSKVSGIYSKIGFTITTGMDLYRPEWLTEEEIAAVILHELGHIWDFLSNLGEIARGSAVTAYATKVIQGNYKIERKLQVIQGLGLESEDPTALGPDELTTLVAMHAFARSETMQASVSYSKNSEEHLADQFAAMHGLAYATATAMRKMEQERWFFLRDKAYRPMWIGAFDAVSEFTTFFSIGYSLGSGSTILMPIVMPLFMTTVMKSIPLFGKAIPVTPMDRIKRMRESLTAALRDPSTTDSERKRILADIKALSGEAKAIKDNQWDGAGPWATLKEIATNLAPTSADAKAYYTRTNLDSLTDNRLFEITARLQGL